MSHTVSVIGLGYIGLPTAVLLASQGVHVFGTDTSEEVVRRVNSGILHIAEPDVASMLNYVVAKGFLQASMQVHKADTYVIAVPTPITEAQSPDLQYIEAVANALAPVREKDNVGILESTSPVGTTEKLAQWLAEQREDLCFMPQDGRNADVHVAYCPERVLPGNIMHELIHNDRIIGGLTPLAAQKACELYGHFVQGTLSTTTVRTAELCKLTENAFRDVNIAFANELSMLCEFLDVDVWELITLANKHPRVNILQAGCGVGGHCIAVDPWFIVDSNKEYTRLIQSARAINDAKPEWIFEKVKDKIFAVLAQNPTKSLAEVRVACLGLSYKPDTCDTRNSPAVEIVQKIATLGVAVGAVSSHVEKLPKECIDLDVCLYTLQEALETADVVCVLVQDTPFIQAREAITKHKSVVDATGLLRA